MIVRTTGFCLAVLFVAVAAAGPAQAQFGVAAGANFERFGDIESTPRATIENASGYHVGLFVELPLGPLSIRPGVFFVDVGDISFSFENGCALPGGCDNFDLTLIQVPVDVRLRAGSLVVKPYLLGGPVFRFADSENESFKASLKEYTVAANAGVGIELAPPSFGLRFFPELRYNFGLDSLVDNYEFLGANFTTEGDLNFDSWMIRLGIMF